MTAMGEMSESASFAVVEDTIPANDDFPPQFGVIVCFRSSSEQPWSTITGVAWDSEEERENNRAMIEWVVGSAAKFHEIPVEHLTPEEVSA